MYIKPYYMYVFIRTEHLTRHIHLFLCVCVCVCRFRELVRGMDKWESWVWPTNPAAHLACPLLVPLFRPHQVEVQVALANWLEVALRTGEGRVIAGVKQVCVCVCVCVK